MNKLQECCPFCGGEAELCSKNGYWYVVCADCGMAPPLLYYSGLNAIQAWNDGVKIWNAQEEEC